MMHAGQSRDSGTVAGPLRISLTEKIEPVRMVLGTPHIDSARLLYGIKVTGELKNTAR
jgi:hypothetical protein